MAEKNLEIQNTLVRYNNPTLVVKHDDKKGEKEVTYTYDSFILRYDAVIRKGISYHFFIVVFVSQLISVRF